MIRSRHTLSHCDLCQCDIVICADCGNNCCNVSTQVLDDGSMCGCQEAYAHQDVMWEDPFGITFAKDERANSRRES